MSELMGGLLILVGLGFGGYKLFRWAENNPNVNVSGKSIVAVVIIACFSLVKWAYGSGSKPSKSSQSWMRSYRCKHCGQKVNTMFNPKETVKSTCSDAYQHQWQRIN